MKSRPVALQDLLRPVVGVGEALPPSEEIV